jgi:hypothetical protein
MNFLASGLPWKPTQKLRLATTRELGKGGQ